MPDSTSRRWMLSDQALALNATSLIPLIQANRAGILVMLGENTEAIDAADVAIAAQGNLTTTWSVAWFNKGNALRNLGRTDEARAAYANATALRPDAPCSEDLKSDDLVFHHLSDLGVLASIEKYRDHANVHPVSGACVSRSAMALTIS